MLLLENNRALPEGTAGGLKCVKSSGWRWRWRRPGSRVLAGDAGICELHH